MRRWTFIAGTVGAVLGFLGGLSPAVAQRERLPKIGWLKIQNKADSPSWLSEFRKEPLLNNHTARTLGVTIPPSMLARVDDIIE